MTYRNIAIFTESYLVKAITITLITLLTFVPSQVATDGTITRVLSL